MRNAPLAALALAAGVVAPVPAESAGSIDPSSGLPRIEATRTWVTTRVGGERQADGWRLAPELTPDTFEAWVPEGDSVLVAFITDVDSIGFMIRVGDRRDFVIGHGTDRCVTRIVGVPIVPAARFDAAYRAAHRGRITVDIPEVYELVNVAIAMTGTGLADNGYVYLASDYHEEVVRWFGPFRDHPAVTALDSVLARQGWMYPNLKMNGYAFEFDPSGTIVQSPVYDRTAFASERRNSLRPLVPLLQSFADTSDFRGFFRAHAPLYESQVAFYRDSADVRGMLDWLDRNFPGIPAYDSHKVIFSPLVAWNQSATWLEHDGFRELQAHVNFPWPRGAAVTASGAPLSERAMIVQRGEIVFTELNHGYINPAADRHADRVMAAIRRRDSWVDAAKGAGYYPGIAAFNEYLNWGLVNLWISDLVADPDERTALIEAVDRMMVGGRGFPAFGEFSRFLVGLYGNRPAGQPVLELYPDIIAWFEAR